MICPTCKSHMIVVEHNKIELDYCTNCKGVWFDSGELGLLLKSMGLESRSLLPGNVLDTEEAKTAEKKRRCPICGRKMKKTTVGQQPEVLIDVCKLGDGLWFDGGEVMQMVRQLAEKQPAKQGLHGQAISFLGEVFKA